MVFDLYSARTVFSSSDDRRENSYCALKPTLTVEVSMEILSFRIEEKRSSDKS